MKMLKYDFISHRKYVTAPFYHGYVLYLHDGGHKYKLRDERPETPKVCLKTDSKEEIKILLNLMGLKLHYVFFIKYSALSKTVGVAYLKTV